MKQINFCGTNHDLSIKTTKAKVKAKLFCFSKSYSIVKNFSKLLILNCKITWLQTSNLVLNLSLISNKDPNLYSVICFELDLVSIANIKLLQNERSNLSSRFLWKLLPFIEKTLYNLSYKPIYGLLCFLRYWRKYR